MSSVALRGLTKRFGSLTVLDNVSLTVEHGKLVCLLGPSGCGKTTALRLIAGFMEPSAGEIALGDRVVSSPARVLPPEQRNVSMVFQSYALWPHMTVSQNVAYGLEIRKLDRATIAKKVDAILATTRLAPLAERYPAELSGGQQQRVSLARALIVEPDTLLLDEPLSNLDANLREEMRFEVRRLHDAYRYTTVYVTHDQSEAMTTADLIAVMNAGRIEQLGTPQEVYEQPRSEFTARFLGGSNILRGPALDATHVTFAGTAVKCSGGPLVAGTDVALSIRQHDIAISARPLAAASRQLIGGHGSAERLSRRHPRLCGRGQGRHAAARHGRAGREFRAGRASLADAARRCLPRPGWIDIPAPRAAQACWMADSSHWRGVPLPGRRKVHTSVTSCGADRLPETRRPEAASTVASRMEKRMATVAYSPSASRQASARSPCSSLGCDTSLRTPCLALASSSAAK